jgi:hypothetical protein
MQGAGVVEVVPQPAEQVVMGEVVQVVVQLAREWQEVRIWVVVVVVVALTRVMEVVAVPVL